MITKVLGNIGRMISHSKSGYVAMYPENLAIFNANVIYMRSDSKDPEKVWYGDIDLTLSRDKLKMVAEIENVDIYILYEMDGRFGYEDVPKIDNYVYKISSNGTETLGKSIKDRISLETMKKL